VEQDVAFGPMNLGLDTETIAHRVDNALRLLEIEHLADRPPHRLSGGEKKRVAIAGILAMEPQILILDEPGSGLDPQGLEELVSFLTSLPERYGMTMIFSTHMVDLVPEIADVVYVIDKGAIVGEGTVNEIFVREDLLRGARLNQPILARLTRSLQEHGIDIATGYSFHEVEEALLGILGVRR
jgi:cobalt/nickel transport system ATP-binding protein